MLSWDPTSSSTSVPAALDASRLGLGLSLFGVGVVTPDRFGVTVRESDFCPAFFAAMALANRSCKRSFDLLLFEELRAIPIKSY